MYDYVLYYDKKYVFYLNIHYEPDCRTHYVFKEIK